MKDQYLYRSKLLKRFEHCYDIFGGGTGLDIVDSVEDVAAVFAEDMTAFLDLLFYFCGRTEGEKLLSIDTAAPENNILAVLLLQCCGIHTGSGALNGVKNVKARLDKQGGEGLDSTATVLKCLPGGVLVDPVVYLLVIRDNLL